MSEQARPVEQTAKRSNLTAWLVVLFAGGVGLSLYFLIAPSLGHHDPGYYRPRQYPFTYGYNRPLLLLFVPYALALMAWKRGARVPLGWLLGGAAVLHVMLLFAPLPQSQDLYQYLFYGRMQLFHPSAQLLSSNPKALMPLLHGTNPYVVHPSVIWKSTWYGWIHWPNQTSVYGPVWSLLSLGIVRVAGRSITAAFVLYKLVVLAVDVAVVWLIIEAWRGRGDTGGREGQGAGWGVLAYAWNPLILIAVPLGGLVDVVVAACLLGAYVARRRGRTGLATVLLSVAALIKVYAIIGLVLHVVLLWRERGARSAVRHGAIFAGMATVLSIPYWAGLDTFKGLFHVADLSNKSLAGTLQRLLAPLLRLAGSNAPVDSAGAVMRWVGIGLLAWAVIWAVRRVRTEADLWPAVLLVLGVYFMVTPWFLFWYLLTPIALVAAMPRTRFTQPALVFSGTSMITAAFPPWLLGQVVQAIARYAAPIVIFARHPEPELRRTDEAASLPPVPPAAPPAEQPVASPLATEPLVAG